MDLLGIALRGRWRIIGLAAAFGLAAVVLRLFEKPQFLVASSFMPQSKGSQSSVSGFAAQLGLALPATGGEQSAAFYADLLKSQTLLRALAYSPLTLQSGRRVSLLDSTSTKTPEGLDSERRVVRNLQKAVNVSVTTRTGVVRLTTSDHDPAIAFALNARLLELLNEYNVASRRNRATSERRFSEERVKEIARDLSGAESKLQEFLMANRQDRKGPLLQAEEDRLRREVNRQQRLFESLSESYEMAKLDEIRDTPVILMVEPPSRNATTAGRSMVTRLILAGVSGALLGLLWTILTAYLNSIRAARPESVSFVSQLFAQFIDEVLHPVRNMRRRLHNS
jgi:uncharacterized protein involved in exopolysaccharide biosynthesis